MATIESATNQRIELVPTEGGYIGGGSYILAFEDKKNYFCWPVHNKACPLLKMPKFAWQRSK